MAGYEYNPLLPLNLQKRSAVSPGDLKNKVPKIKVSISEINVGEIGQKQEGSTADMTEGFFYKRGEGLPVEYEDVTIPVGAKKIIYTNKFDSSQTIVYAFDSVTLPSSVIVNYMQSGKVFLLDSTFHNHILNDYYSWILSYPSIIDADTDGLIYSQSVYIRSYIANSFATSGAGTIAEIQQCFKYLNDRIFYSGFRYAVNEIATFGTISDFILQIAIPIKKGDVESYSYRMCLASDLLAVNWILSDYIGQLYPLTPSPDVFAYDDTRPCYFNANNVFVVFNDGVSKYVLDTNSWSGQRIYSLYQTVSENGEQTRYIVPSHLYCVFDSQPVSNGLVFAQALDVDLYFNYTAEIVDVTESITIRRRIPHYDADGLPLVDKPAIERVDTQPALDPADFATSEQGAKADTALQSISKGTDGEYITTTVTAKDANNQQTVAASLTIQDIANADSTHKGLAEASNVKAYAATAAQGAKADTALQQVVHGTDGLYVTTTVTQKANNEQTISTALTLQGIATADAQHQGVAEASDVRNYLNIIAATSEAYGVMWDTANPSPTLTRIGNMTNHALLPVQSQMIGGVMADDGTFTPFDNQSDWTQATQARDGSDGQVMVRLPKHWRRRAMFGTYEIVMLSPVEIPGYVEVREQYVSAYEASLQRSTLKLSSVNNATADYRGGQNEASWDGTYRTLLNRPVSNLDLTEFRTYARNRAAGTSWNCLTYEAVRTIFWLFAVEYDTLNSQSDYTSELDANGYHQGGLGIGVSDFNGDAWNSFNGYAPLIPCGVLDEYGSRTAVKNFSIYNSDTTLAHTFQCNKYRGIEMPFGHIWKHTDGVLINVEANPGVSAAYVTTDTAYFSSTSIADYSAICNTYRVDSYIKGIVFNADGDIFATTSGGNSTSYYCDNYWGANIPSSGSQLRAWLFGGLAHYGFACGLACASSHYVPGARYRYIGSRLCFVP